MRIRGILPIAAWILLAATACRPPVAAIPSVEPESQIANPASVFCVAHQGTLEIRTGEGGGQIGVCVFPDSSECEEWAYFRAECTPASEASSTRSLSCPEIMPSMVAPLGRDR